MEQWVFEFFISGVNTRFPQLFGPMTRWKIRSLLKARGFTETCTQPHEIWRGNLEGREVLVKLRQACPVKDFLQRFK